MGGGDHSAGRLPTSTGVVHKSVTLRCVFIWVKFTKRVLVRVSVLQMRHSDWSLSSSIMFKYEFNVGHLFVLSLTRVAMGSLVSESCTLSGMVFEMM